MKQLTNADQLPADIRKEYNIVITPDTLRIGTPSLITVPNNRRLKIREYRWTYEIYTKRFMITLIKKSHNAIVNIH